MSYGGGMMTAAGVPLPMQGGGPAGQRAHLYIGNLSSRVTEYMLQEIFSVAGPVLGVKIVPDRNFQHGGLNYGFVEFFDMRSAETAMQTLNGRKIFDTEIKVNWAYQNTAPREDITNHFHIFVGDLSTEVTDSVLQRAFAAFGTLSDARIMVDAQTGKSRGYGFLAFRDRNDAEQAITAMNGEWLGSRSIRVNWANSKQGGDSGGPIFGGSRAGGPPVGVNAHGMATPAGGFGGGFGDPTANTAAASNPINNGLDYATVLQEAPETNCTVYVGQLVPYTQQGDLIPMFQPYGTITEMRLQAERGFAFIKLDAHDKAANAITSLSGTIVHGRPIKCAWGREKISDSTTPSNGIIAPQSANAAPMPSVVSADPAAQNNVYAAYYQTMMSDPAAYAAWYAQYSAYLAANGQVPQANGTPTPGSAQTA